LWQAGLNTREDARTGPREAKELLLSKTAIGHRLKSLPGIAKARLAFYRRRYIFPALCSYSPGRAFVQRYRIAFVNESADFFLLSFPKCGRTWLRLMVGRALALRLDLENLDLMELERMHKVSPAVPRISVTHDDDPQWKTAGQLLRAKTEYRGKRVVLLVRDPRDVVVSNYFQKTRRRKDYRGDLSSFLHQEKGSVDTCIQFFNIWAENRHVPSEFALVRYEDMHADPHAELKRVVRLLGIDEIGEGIVEQAVEYARFDNMRRMETEGSFRSSRLRPRDMEDAESFKTRRGKVGGFVDYLSDEDVRYLNQKVRSELSDFYGYK
jgi:hypothetical protein